MPTIEEYKSDIAIHKAAKKTAKMQIREIKRTTTFTPEDKEKLIHDWQCLIFSHNKHIEYLKFQIEHKER